MSNEMHIFVSSSLFQRNMVLPRKSLRNFSHFEYLLLLIPISFHLNRYVSSSKRTKPRCLGRGIALICPSGSWHDENAVIQDFDKSIFRGQLKS